MKKRIIALLLVMILVVSCLTACGDKDKDKDEKKKPKTYSDIYEMIEDIAGFEKGTVSIALDADLGQKGNGKLTLTIVNDGKGGYALSAAIDADTEDGKINADVDNLLIVKDKMLYLNLGGILKALVSYEPEIGEMFKDLKLGYFAVPLPDDLDTDKILGMGKDLFATVTPLLKNGLKDATVEGEKDEFSVKFENVQAYKTFAGAFADYLDGDAKKAVKESAGKVTDVKIDLNAYATKLINYYYDDIVILAEVAKMSKEDVDKLVAEVKGMDLNEKLGGLLSEVTGNMDADKLEKELTDAAKEIREKIDEISEDDIKDLVIEFTVKTTDDGFKIKGSFEGTSKIYMVDGDGNETVKNGESAKIGYTIKLSEETGKVSAPSDSEITKLRDLKDLVSTAVGMLGGGMMNMGDDDDE